jgi:hypothetical protein
MKHLVIPIMSVFVILSACQGSSIEQSNNTNTHDSQCDDGTEPACRMEVPSCLENQILAYKNSCYECVFPDTCDSRNPVCDDGSDVTCDLFADPVCEGNEVLAIIDSCFNCVDPETCTNTLFAFCDVDQECSNNEYCEMCATSSCPMCADCVAACMLHECDTEEEAECAMPRPSCEIGSTAVVVSGCWECVSIDSCLPID